VIPAVKEEETQSMQQHYESFKSQVVWGCIFRDNTGGGGRISEWSGRDGTNAGLERLPISKRTMSCQSVIS
jgi:hypothetical protein